MEDESGSTRSDRLDLLVSIPMPGEFWEVGWNGYGDGWKNVDVDEMEMQTRKSVQRARAHAVQRHGCAPQAAGANTRPEMDAAGVSDERCVLIGGRGLVAT